MEIGAMLDELREKALNDHSRRRIVCYHAKKYQRWR